MPFRRIFLFTIAAGAAGCAVSCANPRAEANVAQALNDAANEISGLKNDIAALQTEMDSLKETMAKQDTLISRIMALNNMPK